MKNQRNTQQINKKAIQEHSCEWAKFLFDIYQKKKINNTVYNKDGYKT
ncbi:hypothetical protein ACFL14_00830 [Patescibacteria group bacterium]